MAKKKEEKVERELVVGMQQLKKYPRPRRARKAITLLERFVFKHFRVKGENVLISNKVNEAIWSKGREKPAKKLAIKVVVFEGKANVFLKGEKVHLEKEKKEEKKEKKKTEEEKALEEEKQRKIEGKKLAEKAAEKAAIKRGTE